MTYWSVKTNFLFIKFKDSVEVLLPHLKAVKLFLDSEAGNDDWDDLIESLYNAVVVGAVLNDRQCVGVDIKFIRYDFSYDRLVEHSFVSVKCEKILKPMAFKSFCINKEETISVKVHVLDDNLNVVDEADVDFLDCDFAISINIDNVRTEKEALEVVM